jgi:hypothetical protein
MILDYVSKTAVTYYHECFDIDKNIGMQSLIWNKVPLSHFNNSLECDEFNKLNRGKFAGWTIADNHHYEVYVYRGDVDPFSKEIPAGLEALRDRCGKVMPNGIEVIRTDGKVPLGFYEFPPDFLST